jgi:MFS transporter, ACS family, hexuronate transporter
LRKLRMRHRCRHYCGMLMSKYAGWVLDSIGSYTPIFMVAGAVYFLALAAIHVLSPRMQAVTL